MKVIVTGNNIDLALKTLKRKMIKEGIIKQYKHKITYSKKKNTNKYNNQNQ